MIIDIKKETDKVREILEKVAKDPLVSNGRDMRTSCAIIMSVSDGSATYGDAPKGELTRVLVDIRPWIGGDPLDMLLELMRGIQYQAGNGDELLPEIVMSLLTELSLPGISPEKILQSMLAMTRHTRDDIVVMGIKRMIRRLNAEAVLCLIDGDYLSVGEPQTHVYLASTPNYYECTIRPYTVDSEGHITYDDDPTSRVSSRIGDILYDRFSNLFEVSDTILN